MFDSSSAPNKRLGFVLYGIDAKQHVSLILLLQFLMSTKKGQAREKERLDKDGDNSEKIIYKQCIPF